MSYSEQLIHGVAEAIRSHDALPAIDESCDLDDAYKSQHQTTMLRSPEGSGGIKLGVTTKAAQDFLKLDHALLGSLYADSRLESGCTIPFLEGRSLETEFAVIIDGSGHPKLIAPAIEIVCVKFSRPADMSASSLVLSNLGADLFLVGEFLPWESPHREASAILRHGDTVVNEASMNDALGGPAEALPWVYGEASARGYAIADETLIMMGACGSVVPAERGIYSADFGLMGKVSFTIE